MTPAPDRLDNVDRALVDALVAEGVEEPVAIFVAATGWAASAIDERSDRLIASFPTGNTAEIVIAVTPNHLHFDPVAVANLSPDGSLIVSLSFWVPNEAVSEEDLRRILGFGGALGVRLALARPQTAGADMGLRVVVDGTVEVFRGEALRRFLEAAGGPELRDHPFLQAVSVAGPVTDAWATSPEYRRHMAELDALRDCVLRRSGSDAAKKQLLDEIEQVRDEVTANTIVLFLGLEVSVGKDVIPIPQLSDFLGAPLNQAMDDLRTFNREAVQRVTELVGPCEGYVFTGLVTQGRAGAYLAGLVCGDPHTTDWLVLIGAPPVGLNEVFRVVTSASRDDTSYPHSFVVQEDAVFELPTEGTILRGSLRFESTAEVFSWHGTGYVVQLDSAAIGGQSCVPDLQ